MHVYLDNAATTILDPIVLDAMMPFFKEHFGNPSSIHTHGREAKSAIEKARKQLPLFSTHHHLKYFSHQEEQKPTIPLSQAALKLLTSSMQSLHQSSIMQCCIPWSTWKRKEKFNCTM